MSSNTDSNISSNTTNITSSNNNASNSSSGINEKDKETLSLQLKNAELSLSDWIDRYNRRGDENDRLRQDIKLQGEEIMSIQSRLKEAQILLSEAMEAKVPMQFEINKLSRERDSLQGRLKLVEDEVTSKSQQLISNNAHMNTTNASFETRLKNECDNNKELAGRITSLQDKISTQNTMIEDYSKKIRELEESSSKTIITTKQEIDSLKKFADTYKKYFDEATIKTEELEKFKQTVTDEHAKQVSSLKTQMKQQIEKKNEEFVKERNETAAKIKTLEQQLEQQSRLNVVPVSNDKQVVQNSYQVPPGFEGLGITDMFTKSMTLEKELLEERKKRSDVQLELDHLRKDVQASKPIIANQKRDYNRIVESYTMINKQHDDLLSESSKLKRSFDEANEKIKELTDAVIYQEQISEDLSRQLQHVLKENFNTPSRQVAVISDLNDEFLDDRLITFDSIIDLQKKNETYLRTIRKLEIEKERHTRDTNPTPKGNEDLMIYAKELASLREDRQRTEEIVAAIIQERDAYKAIIDDADLSSSALSLITTTDKGRYDLNSKVSELEDENKRLKNHNNRIVKAEELLSETLEKTKAECSSLRLELVSVTSDLRFYKDRSEKNDNEMKSLQSENLNTNNRRHEIEKMLIDQQKDFRESNDRLLQVNEVARTANDNLKKCQIELEVLKASEKRLLEQISNQREDLKTQTSLADSIRRIETDLLSRAEAEKNILQQERDDLAKKVETLRKEVSQSGYLEDQRIQALEDQLNKQRLETEKKATELTTVQEELLKERSDLKVSQQRVLHVEKSLELANERLDAITAAKVMDSVAASEQEQREAAFKKATSQIEVLSQQLSTAESQVEHYKKIYSKSEEIIKDIQDRSAAAKIAREEELSRLQNELDTVHKQLSDSRSFGMELEKEVHNSRDLIKNADKKLEEGLKSLEEKANASQLHATKAQEQLEKLKEDMQVLQKNNKDARANYERELKLHSQAETALREKEDELEALKKDFVASQSLVTTLQSTVQNSSSSKEREQSVLLKENEELKEHMKLMKNTNDILQTELLSIKTRTDEIVNTSNIDILSSENENNETTELRKHAATLNELLKNMKKEKDLQDAQIARIEVERDGLNNTLITSQRALDEAKASLKKEQEKKVSKYSDEEYNQLKAEAARVTLLQDSNAYLHQQKESLQKRITQVEEDLKQAKNANKPLENTIKSLEKEKSSLEKVNEGLVNDNNYYGERLKKLYANYDNIDPEEHRLLQVKITQMETSANEMKTELLNVRAEMESKEKTNIETFADFESKLTSANDAKNTIQNEIDVLKRTNINLDDTCNKLRTKLREMQTKINEMKAENVKLGETIKSNAEEKAKDVITQKPPIKAGVKAAVPTPGGIPAKPTGAKPVGTSTIVPINATAGGEANKSETVAATKLATGVKPTTSAASASAPTPSSATAPAKAPVKAPVTKPPAPLTKPPAPLTKPPAPSTKPPIPAPVIKASISAPVTKASIPAPVTKASIPAPVTKASIPAPVAETIVSEETDTKVSNETSVKPDESNEKDEQSGNIDKVDEASKDTSIAEVGVSEKLGDISNDTSATTEAAKVTAPKTTTTRGAALRQKAASIATNTGATTTLSIPGQAETASSEVVSPPPKVIRKRKNQSPVSTQTKPESDETVSVENNAAALTTNTDVNTDANTAAAPIDDKKAARAAKMKAQLAARIAEAATSTVDRKTEEPASKKARPSNDEINDSTNTVIIEETTTTEKEDAKTEHDVPSLDETQISKKARIEVVDSKEVVPEEVIDDSNANMHVDAIDNEAPLGGDAIESATVNSEEIVDIGNVAEMDVENQEENVESDKIMEEVVEDNTNNDMNEDPETEEVKPNEEVSEDVDNSEVVANNTTSFFKNPSSAFGQSSFFKKAPSSTTLGENKSLFGQQVGVGGGLNPMASSFTPTWNTSPSPVTVNPVLDSKEEGEITEKPAPAATSFFVNPKIPTPQGSPRGGLSNLAKPASSLFRKTPTQQIELIAPASTSALPHTTTDTSNANTDTTENVADVAVTEKLEQDNTEVLEEGEITSSSEVIPVAASKAATPKAPVKGGKSGTGKGQQAIAANPVQATTINNTQESPTLPTTTPKHVSQMTVEERKAHQEKLMTERKARFEQIKKENEEKADGK